MSVNDMDISDGNTQEFILEILILIIVATLGITGKIDADKVISITSLYLAYLFGRDNIKKINDVR